MRNVSAACSKCGAVLAPGGVFYDERGEIICPKCSMEGQVVQDYQRLAAKVKRIAYGAPAFGLASIFFNPMWLISIAAIVNGLYVLRSIRDKDTRPHLEGSIGAMQTMAVIGMSIGGVTALVRVVSLLSMIAPGAQY